MLNIWNNKDTIEIKSSLKSYLYRSCYNEFIDDYKKRQKELDYIESIKFQALDFFVEEDSDNINKKVKLIYTAIEELPPKCKEVFKLHKIKGLKYREVAELLGISIKTVEVHMGKALRKIKKMF